MNSKKEKLHSVLKKNEILRVRLTVSVIFKTSKNLQRGQY